MSTATAEFNAEQVQSACNEAAQQARSAAKAYYDTHGDRDSCGFAWVDVYGVRSNSRLGKTLQSFGFRKGHTGSLQLWNPSGSPTQSITVKEEAAIAYARVLTEKLGIRAYAGSRLD